ncbi:Mur ligase family protein [Abiotrophia defectiva]|uniref:bifunctional folylpolyglutamate synthase/dihydrofolate synthase n=1 Tax=Abiotrophia defectiva TaxID=46125 RepID=UPI0028D215EC|nr:Mur ligase family protein [Abiotrophia defectiva]
MGQEMTSIEAAHAWLSLQTSHQLRPGFDRMRHALSLLGQPQESLPSIIQLAGTNGKGSTLAYLQGLFISQGLRVGAFSSPHILAFNERLMVNGQPIEDEKLLELVRSMVKLNEKLMAQDWGPLSGFELYTVMMLVYFSQCQLDVCLIEAGVGGLWDCTNVLEADIALITTIGYDHQDRLGHSLAEIAQQKFGIIKPSTKIVGLGRLPQEALAVLPEILANLNYQGDIMQLGWDFHATPAQEGKGLAKRSWQVELPSGRRFDQVTIAMLGQHQGDNLALALASFEAWMNQMKREIDWDQALAALEQVNWQGRLECLSHEPLILVDGAHNSQGLQALDNFLTHDLADYQVTLIFAGLKRKDQASHLTYLHKWAEEGIEVYLSTFDYPGAMTQADWQAQTALPFLDWQPKLVDYQASQKQAKKALILTGSLYFISQVKEFFR